MDFGEKDSKGNQRITIHIYPKPAHLITLPSHLGLQAPDLFLALLALSSHLGLDRFLALTDLRGEPGGHALNRNL